MSCFSSIFENIFIEFIVLFVLKNKQISVIFIVKKSKWNFWIFMYRWRGWKLFNLNKIFAMGRPKRVRCSLKAYRRGWFKELIRHNFIIGIKRWWIDENIFIKILILIYIKEKIFILGVFFWWVFKLYYLDEKKIIDLESFTR